MKLAEKKVLVVGCGKSGIGAAVFLVGEGACPVLFDENEKLTEKEVRAVSYTHLTLPTIQQV